MTGSDDFVVMSTFYAFVHGGLAIASVILAERNVTSDCGGDDGVTLKNALIATSVANFVSGAVYALLAFSSSRGSVFQTSRRWFVPVALYCAVVCVLVLLGSNTYAAIIVFRDELTRSCVNSDPLIMGIQAITILNFIMPLLAACVMLLHFDCHGGRSFESYDSYEQVWERRCSVLCCCCMGGASAEEALLEAARTMAILFRGYDIVPSDIAAAFVLIQSYQRRQFNKRLLALSTSAPTSPLTAMQQRNQLISAQSRRFHRFTPDQKSILMEMRYYSKYYLAAYGWLLFWYEHLFTGLPRLWASDCTMCCRRRSGVHIGDCCYCNNTALHKVAGLQDRDILFTHFKNELYYPCFYVAKDDRKKTVVIAVRGTMSLQDCITDVVAAPEKMNLSLLDDAYVHSGMLRSATNIYDAMFSHLVIDDIIRGTYSSHQLVVVGHSLGAGTAAILTIMLHDRYPELRERIRCFAYAPPGGLLSSNLALHCASFVIGCLMGKDLVPRLAAHTMNDLRDSMMRALAATPRTKTVILCHCCCPPDSESLLPDVIDITNKTIERTQKLREIEASPLQPQEHIRLTVKLYPPAQMIHYAKVMTRVPCCAPCICCNTRVYCPSWIDPEELQEVLCSPFMAADHMPDRLFDCIQRTGDEIESGKIVEYQDTAASSLEPHTQSVSFNYKPPILVTGTGGQMVTYQTI